MKCLKKLMLVLLVTLMVGCNGVQLSPTYSEILDRNAAITAAAVEAAQNPNVTKDMCVQFIAQQAKMWELFKDARDGKKPLGNE